MDTAHYTARPQGSGAADTRQDTFGLEFRENVALLCVAYPVLLAVFGR